jgi:hypothetical protein
MNSAENNFSLGGFFKFSSNQRTQMDYGHIPQQFGENGAGFDRPSEQNTKFRMREILSCNTAIQLFNPIRCSVVQQSSTVLRYGSNRCQS